jgi:hypothetical protein
MAAPTRIYDISTTAASNSPTGTESVGTGLDDYLRAIQTVYRLDLASKGADIASATTTDLGAVGGLFHDITGTTTITGFGTVAAGIWKIIKFEGALTLTHNATSLILPGGANITTADGDIAVVISEGSGNWRCVSYQSVATQAVMEAGASTGHIVTPGRQHYHPSAAKAWVKFSGTGTPTIAASYNVTSITDNGTGDYTVTFTNALSSANYCSVASAALGGGNAAVCYIITQATTGVRVATGNIATTFSAVDADNVYVVVFGDI